MLSVNPFRISVASSFTIQAFSQTPSLEFTSRCPEILRMKDTESVFLLQRLNFTLEQFPLAGRPLERRHDHVRCGAVGIALVEIRREQQKKILRLPPVFKRDTQLADEPPAVHHGEAPSYRLLVLWKV